jgi:hypothetical protein
MSQITVTFDSEEPDKYEHDYPDFPVEVTVGEMLFEDAGGNLVEMTAEDKQEYDAFIRGVAPEDAVEEALSVVAVAPAFDDIRRSQVAPANDHVNVSVEYDLSF